VAFGPRGGITAGVAAALRCGPLLPLDTGTGEQQLLANWLIRGTFLVGVGTFVGAIATALRASYRAAIEERIDHELAALTAALGSVEDRLGSEIALSLNCSPTTILDPRLLRAPDTDVRCSITGPGGRSARTPGERWTRGGTSPRVTRPWGRSTAPRWPAGSGRVVCSRRATCGGTG
jgi:hypothetical protein